MTHYPLGLHRMAADVYHADPMVRPSLTSSLGRLIIKKSPRHAWTASPRLNPNWKSADKQTFRVGRAAHRELLGAGDPYTVIPSGLLDKAGGASTKEAKAFIADCNARGITPLKRDVADQIAAMVDTCREALTDFKLNIGGHAMPLVIDPEHSERAALAEIDGCACRALFDNLPADYPYFVDFKTTEDASVSACIRSIVAYRYAFQMQHYRECLHAATGEWRTPVLVFQEKDEPCEVAVVTLHYGDDDADWEAVAIDQCRVARYEWSQCLAAGEGREHWPGYPRVAAEVGAPVWYQTEWANRPRRPSREALRRAAAWQSPEGME